MIVDDELHDLITDLEAAESGVSEIAEILRMGSLGRWEVPSKDAVFVSPKNEADRVRLGVYSMRAIFASANLEMALQRLTSRRDTLALELRSMIVQRVK
jgi:hypothetical protein